jgi:Uma2 family endonuclease
MSSTTTVPVATERPVPPPAPVSFEAFLAWADEDTLAEWVDGEIVLMTPNSVDHQDLLAFVYDLVKAHVQAHALGKVYFAPILMHLPTRPSGREPDLLFIAAEHLDRLQPTYLDGPADLVVEIVSPESVVRDRGEKFAEYEGAGIPEYWLIDPLRREAAFYQLGPDGLYQRGAIDAEGVYRSAVLPGFWLRVDWLWQRPLPSVSEVTRQIGI